MKVILVANLKPPFNLRRIHPNPQLLLSMTEEEMMAHVVAREKEVGVVPCETEAERDACLILFAVRHPKLPLIDLPPIGVHHIVDEIDLPGGSISEDNDYFFNAWEWATDKVGVNMPKARDVQMGHIRTARDIELNRQDILLMVAAETGNTSEETRIKALKQTLRGIPSSFDLDGFTDTVSLKAAWPAELPERA